MNTMTESELRDRLANAMPEPAADGPLHPAVAADVELGRRLLARRRRAIALGVVAPTVLVAAGVGSVLTGTASPPATAAYAAVPTDDTKLIEACRTGDLSSSAEDALWAAGEPVIAASAYAADSAVLALRSADGTRWGQCLIQAAWGENRTTADPELDASGGAYGASGVSTDLSAHKNLTPNEHTLHGCRQDETCTNFAVLWADRVPVEVAAIEVRTGDGHTSRIATTDGFFAFGYTGDLPRPVNIGHLYEEFPGFAAIERITYLDAAGRPLASGTAVTAAGRTTYEAGPGETPLAAYPSLRGDLL